MSPLEDPLRGSTGVKAMCTLHVFKTYIDIRLDAIEASLDEMKQLLRSQLGSYQSTSTDHGIPSTDNSALTTIKDLDENEDNIVLPTITSADLHPAPITVVRHVGNLITEPETNGENDSILGHMTEMGLDSENFASVFQHGFEQIASWYPFPHETMSDLKQNYPLLFAMCLLAGFRATAGLNRSNLHITLHSMVKTHLGMKALDTPIGITTIHAMLIFSAWSFGPLVPGGRYIDSWLMSSTTITHCMLSFSLSELGSLTSFYDDTSRNMCRMWIQASLVHLKFAIGTGRPSVVTCDRLRQWTEIVKYPGFETFDQIIAAELKIYILLYEVICNSANSVGEAWELINRWSRKYLADGNSVLTWARSCVSLILSRWELAKQQQGMSPGSLAQNERLKDLTQTVIRHAQVVLSEILIYGSSETAFVRPTYDYLLSAYAGVTLAEYSSDISDIHATYTLMENVRTQARIPRSIDGVFSWATNVVQKKARDYLDSSVSINSGDTLYSYPMSVADWAPFRFIDSLPSSGWDGLEESMRPF
ncbi:uncharacterized protein N7511_010784 [Penicillium nucicola]|uniref:uncharacterized protein n=1 Tax=Penicillium nucicola TaxID=1850975 RepID=UPI00254566F5|nr:uncharacterized protein N7511_010784 [Penicillium nucicola]KAJ5749088.1 hypothetical protein N7511_010784 [Penicillium nucicola]